MNSCMPKKVDNLTKKETFLETYKVPTLTHKEMKIPVALYTK